MTDIDSECTIPETERTPERAQEIAARFVSKYTNLNGPPSEVVDVPKKYAATYYVISHDLAVDFLLNQP